MTTEALAHMDAVGMPCVEQSICCAVSIGTV